MNIEIKNLKMFNDLAFIAHSAKVSGIDNNMSDKEIFNMILDNDYSSALEHIIFTFEIHGLSKGNSAELLEHRIASHTGRSTRYINETDFDFVISPIVSEILKKYNIAEQDYKKMLKNKNVQLYSPTKRDREIIELFSHSIYATENIYKSLIELKVPKESARYVLPFSIHTAYTYTINLRSLINFLGLRLCVRASPEMRCLATNIYIKIRTLFPQIDSMWCRGYNNTVCPENEVRDSPQGKECIFKILGSNIFIPTKKDIQKGINIKPLDKERFNVVKENLLNNWKRL